MGWLRGSSTNKGYASSRAGGCVICSSCSGSGIINAYGSIDGMRMGGLAWDDGCLEPQANPRSGCVGSAYMMPIDASAPSSLTRDLVLGREALGSILLTVSMS